LENPAVPISEAAWPRPLAVAGGTMRQAMFVINPSPLPIPVAANEREPFSVNNAESFLREQHKDQHAG
jgi:hypothetical protein